jgi:MbtH protein
VVNAEEQYSIWASDRQVPLGWRPAGKTGTKEECLSYIGEIWTDMRPRSLREAMEPRNKAKVPAKPASRKPGRR